MPETTLAGRESRSAPLFGQLAQLRLGNLRGCPPPQKSVAPTSAHLGRNARISTVKNGFAQTCPPQKCTPHICANWNFTAEICAFRAECADVPPPQNVPPTSAQIEAVALSNTKHLKCKPTVFLIALPIPGNRQRLGLHVSLTEHQSTLMTESTLITTTCYIFKRA